MQGSGAASLTWVLRLLALDERVHEELLEALVGEVDAQLLERVPLEVLEPEQVEEADGVRLVVLHLSSMRRRVEDVMWGRLGDAGHMRGPRGRASGERSGAAKLPNMGPTAFCAKVSLICSITLSKSDE